MSPFEILGVDSSITEAELKSEYTKLDKRYHPDRYKDDGSAFCKVTNAYEEAIKISKDRSNIKQTRKKVVIRHKNLFSFRQDSI